MRYLLDTNVLSEVRKGVRCHPAVSRWFQSRYVPDVFTSVLVIGELRNGIERLRRSDPTQAWNLERWLETLITRFAGRVLIVDRAVAEEWGRIAAPDPLPPVDGLLAATAIVHDMTLVTRDAAGLEKSGVRVLNPFESK
ncbi:MAG: type II toxin-antitoxin system VapC family toxin [Alphaproteobacteria bacterium]|nr:type II toxin-antitoxin system VapC family toxin [Alphaproteobacteria bacterium]